MDYYKNIDAAREFRSPGRFLFVLLYSCIIAFSCSNRKDLIDQKLYEGPLSSLDSISTLLSDSAEVVMRLTAARQNDFESGDTEWPQGFKLEIFGRNKNPETIFTANYVYYTKEEDLYRAEGNVEVENLKSGDKLNTEELFWNPTEEEFHTEKFVTIKSDDEVHTGEGMKGNQDFTNYQILKPTGTFLIEDN
ncbi:MAG: LPS export ABC transporter periplasmic protein LptC [Cyclobacteriaceae bacterium]